VVYRYLNPPVDERSRLINPVGFQVTQFRIDPVVVPTAPVAGMTARGAK
jgi:type IV secretory pathway component VirB8